MKRTLLDYTQNILSALNSDEVNSISDTTESMQVAEIVKTTYYDLINRTKLPELSQLFQLTASGDADLPTVMYRPDHVSKIEWVKYYVTTNGELDYKYVTILPMKQFLDMTNEFNTDDSDVDAYSMVIGGQTFNFRYKDSNNPTYCTVIKDYYIIFDSYDVTVDTTLQASKTMCFGEILPSFLMEDDFYPEIDEQQVPLLLNEAKSLAFLELKQMPHPKAEQGAKRQWSNLQKNKSVIDKPSYFDQLAYFGRK